MSNLVKRKKSELTREERVDKAYSHLVHAGISGAGTVAVYFAAALLPLLSTSLAIFPLIATIIFSLLFYRTIKK